MVPSRWPGSSRPAWTSAVTPRGLELCCSASRSSGGARRISLDLTDLLHEILVAQVATYLGVEPSVIDPSLGAD